MPSPKKRRNMRTAVAWRCTHKPKNIIAGGFWLERDLPFSSLGPLVSGLLVILQEQHLFYLSRPGSTVWVGRGPMRPRNMQSRTASLVEELDSVCSRRSIATPERQ